MAKKLHSGKMADIFTHFRNRFNRNPELISTKPTVQKPLETSLSENAGYETWKKSNLRIALTHWLREEFLAYQCSPNNTEDGVDFFMTPNTKGFRMHPALSPFSDNAVHHFFTYLKDRFLATDCQATLSDTRIYGRGVFDETIHRYILKPKQEFAAFSQAQLELVLKDNKLVALRLEMSIAHSEMPQTSNNFADLLDNLLA